MPVAGRDEADMGTDASKSGSAAMLTDAQVAGVTDFVNNAEIQQAQLAQSKSKNPQVLNFASMMISHHTQARQQQSSLNLSTAGSSVLQTMSSEGQRTMASLRDKSGQDFDRAYLQAQIDQHQKVLDTLDRQLLPSAKNTQLRTQLQSLRPTIQQHLQAARDAQKALASGQSGQQGSSGQGSSGQGSSGQGSSSSGSTQRTGTGSATQP